MADGNGAGRALRVYQILLILGAGWAVGRLPDLFRHNEAEAAQLRSALGSQPADAAPLTTDERIAMIAGEVAARVAASAANETVARLMAAGWGPAGSTAPSTPQTIIIREQSAPAPVIRVVSETPAWSLPPTALAQAPAPGTSAQATAPGALVQQPAAQPIAAPLASRPGEASAYAMASQGYAALKAGDRKQGAALLSAALATDPAAPQAKAWTADIKRLSRHWSGEIYTLARGAGNSDPLAASPVLGGGQSGLALAYTVNPLSGHPVSIVGRVTGAAGSSGALDPDTVEGALGLRVKPLAKLPLAIDIERRFALGPLARSTWAARVSGGGQMAVGPKARVELYGEGGVVGLSRPDYYAGGQLRAGAPLFVTRRMKIDAAAGAWGGWQHSANQSLGRLDSGPSVRLNMEPWPFSAQIDYRWRTAGKAEPGSGPVLTIAGQF